MVMTEDPAVEPAVSARFARTRGTNTKPELLVRRELHRRGFRFRVHARPVMGVRRTADIVFTKARVAVLIDGCFFHGCPTHYVVPKTRTEFWSAKIKGNVARDIETTGLFESAGWTVLRFWEHEDVDAVVTRIADVVMAARGT